MRIKTLNGYWVMENYTQVKFFILKREAKSYMVKEKLKEPKNYIKKGTYSYKI